MKTTSTNPKVLLCTVYRRFPNDYMDLLGEVILRNPKITMLRRVSPGLRFIKQNIPEVELLEYPLWQEFQAKLNEGWDIIGFSFYLFILIKLFLMLTNLIKNSPDAHHKTYGILAQSSFFIFLSFHMTNVTSGIFFLSLWSIYTGAIIGIGLQLNPGFQRRNVYKM